MKTIALILALCGSVVVAAPVPPEVPKVEPWNTTVIEGLVIADDVIFATKSICVVSFARVHFLGFATRGEYEAALRLIGKRVRIEGIVVDRGSERWIVPNAVREMRE